MSDKSIVVSSSISNEGFSMRKAHATARIEASWDHDRHGEIRHVLEIRVKCVHPEHPEMCPCDSETLSHLAERAAHALCEQISVDLNTEEQSPECSQSPSGEHEPPLQDDGVEADYGKPCFYCGHSTDQQPTSEASSMSDANRKPMTKLPAHWSLKAKAQHEIMLCANLVSEAADELMKQNEDREDVVRGIKLLKERAWIILAHQRALNVPGEG